MKQQIEQLIEKYNGEKRQLSEQILKLSSVRGGEDVCRNLRIKLENYCGFVIELESLLSSSPN